MAKKMEPYVRLFITSRPNLYLKTELTAIYQINIVARGSDIQTYLKSVIDTNNRLCDLTAQDPNLKVDIIKRLNETADGM
jgi:hypothetical protein